MSCPFNNTFSTLKPIIRPDPSVGTTINLYNETFTWTDQHVLPSELNQWRRVGDRIVDEFYNEQGPELKDDVDIYDFVQQNLPNFVQSIRERPKWFNKKQVKKGQLVFLKHTPQALAAIFHYVLLGGYGFQQMNNVLSKTQYLLSSDLQSTYCRLVETVQMIVSVCTGDIDDFDKTCSNVIRVRFLHGIVRYKINKNNADDIPINQEDLLTTLLGFSFLMLRCFENRMNIYLSTEEKQSYLHLWRYVGWLIGIEDKYLSHISSYDAAQKIFESIFYHHYFPTAISKHLAHHTMFAVYLHRQDSVSYRFHIALTQRLLEPKLLEAMNLHEPIVADRLHLLAVSGLLKLFKFVSWLCTKNFPFVSKFVIDYNTKKLKQLIQSGLNEQNYKFALNQNYKPTKTKVTPLINCPCGYFEKRQKQTTNDFGIFRGTVEIRLLSSMKVLFSLLILLTVGYWILKSCPI